MLLGSARPVYDPREPAAGEVDDVVEDEFAEDEELEDDDVEDEGDEAEGDDEGEDEEPAPAPKSRGANRIATLAAERQAERERADRLERELAAERAQRTQAATTQADQAEAARVANMSAEERLEYLIQKQGQTTAAKLQQIEFNAWDANDKLAFATKAASNPALRGLEAEVEAAVAQMRAQGSNAPRETVAAYILGQKALGKMTKSGNAGAKKSAAARDRQTGKPTSGRGDVAADRTRGDKNDVASLEKRLAGVRI